MAVLENKYRAHRQLIPALFKGQVQADPNDKSHVEAIDVIAKYATYRVYLNHLDERPGQVDRAFKEFEGDLNDINRNKPNTQGLADIYREKVRLRALEVIQYDKAKPIHKLYNARVLAKVAELGEGKLAETLLALLQDANQRDDIRFYALRGLRALLARAALQPMPPVMSKDEEAKCSGALIAFLERKPDLPAEPSLEELDGYRMLRREAVRALAQVRTSAFNDKLRPALTLARFAGDDERIQPSPRVDERVEAALGLARVLSAQDKSYQPDYAANLIGKAIAALGVAANEDRGKEVIARRKPWKIEAARLSEALAALKADSGKNAYVSQVVDRGTKTLQAIIKGDLAEPGDLTWFTTPDNDPPSKELFKGAADSAVKPAKPMEATEK